ncbi:MAG TPA: sugar phosphate isomerase/epimerase [Sedimentisphaerales bacterium]|nr:sugar phosphate isomerase/epimerase [Sedimentisphaerales bacterium]
MARPVTLFTGQWADLSLEKIAKKAASWGYDGVELACWGDHFDVDKALADDSYCKAKRDLLKKHGLEVFAISTHLVGQAVCDNIDERHKAILPKDVWGDGDPEGVRQRAAQKVIDAAKAAKKLGVEVVNGFTGSSIWHMLHSFPPASPDMIEAGYADFAKRFKPILDAFKAEGVKFALEVQPTEIAFDIASAKRVIEAVRCHEAFGFCLNYDTRNLGYRAGDYIKFIRTFGNRIFHAHMKDVFWDHSDGTMGAFGGHTEFADPRRHWDFRSIGHGDSNFERTIVTLNDIGYQGPLSVELEGSQMEREHNAKVACRFLKKANGLTIVWQCGNGITKRKFPNTKWLNLKRSLVAASVIVFLMLLGKTILGRSKDSLSHEWMLAGSNLAVTGIFGKHNRKRNWPKELGPYVDSVIKYLDTRPKAFPTLSDTTHGHQKDELIRNLLVLERRRRRKVDDLLDKLTEAVEKRQFRDAERLDTELEATIWEILKIRLKIHKRVPSK